MYEIENKTLALREFVIEHNNLEAFVAFCKLNEKLFESNSQLHSLSVVNYLKGVGLC